MSARGALLGCALAASLLGCAPQGDCPPLLEAIAPRLARIKETQPTTPDPPSPADLRATSAAYADLASAMEHLEIGEGAAKVLAVQYKEIAVELAKGYEVLAKALEAEDEEKLKVAKATLGREGTKERQLFQKLGVLCAAR